MGSFALDGVVQYVDEGLELTGEGWGKVEKEPAPNLALLECPEVIASNDAQIVSGTLEGNP